MFNILELSNVIVGIDLLKVYAINNEPRTNVFGTDFLEGFPKDYDFY